MKKEDVDLFFPGYSKAVDSLKAAFRSNTGMPLELTRPGNFYASSTASALLALNHIGALNAYERQQWRDALLRLRSHRVNPGDVHKAKEDDAAWDPQEGASVWNTSGAVWALWRTGYNGPEIERAVAWIVRSYNREAEFSPLSDRFNLFIAANAVQCLRLAGRAETNMDVKRIIQEIVAWVRENAQPVAGMFCWGNTKGAAPDPTATLCALWILYDCGEKGLDKRRISGAMNYLRSTLRGSHGMWAMTPVYDRMPIAGHNPQVIHSYTPSFVIPLLRMHVDPFDPLVLEPIRWLREHMITDPATGMLGWDNARHVSVPLSFTTGFALWAIHDWAVATAKSAHAEIEQTRAPTVFIVHGRDPANQRESIRAALNEWRIPDPLIVMEEPNALDTIFARVTQAALLCDYAIVLATPDDAGGLATAVPPFEPRARQNVILELGLFLGLYRYRRNRISLLTYGDPRLPSDLDGVLRITMENPHWRGELHNALLVAGIISER